MELKAFVIGLIMSGAAFVAKGQDIDNAPVLASNTDTEVFSPDSPDLTNQIDIYPNPTVNYVIVKITNSDLKRVTFQLHSVIGNTVDLEAEKIGTDRYKIDLREFSSGYYFLIVEDKESQFKEAIKFLKK